MSQSPTTTKHHLAAVAVGIREALDEGNYQNTQSGISRAARRIAEQIEVIDATFEKKDFFSQCGLDSRGFLR